MRPAVVLGEDRRPFMGPARRLLDDAADRLGNAADEEARLTPSKLDMDAADPSTVVGQPIAFVIRPSRQTIIGTALRLLTATPLNDRTCPCGL